MSEPTYYYTPGSGWVPMFERKMLAFDSDKKAIWLIDRPPENGELYLGYDHKNDHWYVNGQLDFAGPIEYMGETSISELNKFNNENKGYWTAYMTVVPCD